MLASMAEREEFSPKGNVLASQATGGRAEDATIHYQLFTINYSLLTIHY